MGFPSKELKTIMKTAERQNWTVTIRKSGHLKWQAPSGFVYFSGTTPSDPRALKNLVADLRRAGLTI